MADGDTLTRQNYRAMRRPSARAKGDSNVPSYLQNGPAKLAAQPAVAAYRDRLIDGNWITLRQHFEARLNMLRSWRYSWMTSYQLLEAYILPQRGIFINAAMPTPNTMIRGVQINQTILDPTGTQAMRVCAAAMMSGLMSPGRPWFKLKPAMFSRDNISKDGQEWFEEVEDRIYQTMARSNFYQEGAQMFEDLCTFATSPMIIYEDEKDLARAYVPCPGEYFLANSPNGANEGFYRQFVWTVAQIVEFFGLENCPPDVQALWQTKGGSLEVEKIVSHAIEPNFPVQISPNGQIGVVKGEFTWREAYWVWGAANDYPLSLAGYHENPVVCPRWATTSNDAYGRGIGFDVLPDIMQLQVMTARFAEAIEKQVRPPMLASMEMKNEPSSTLPGHLTYVVSLGADKGMRPAYEVNPEIREMAENIAMIQGRVKSGFLNDLFLMAAETKKDQTAYETAVKQQEKMQVLGPVQERFQKEFAAPAVKRFFRILERKKLLPPLPKELQGIPLDIEFVSILATAQKATATTAMERFAQITGSLTQAYPEAKFALDPIGFLTEYGQLIGVSARATNDADKIQQLIAAMQKQQQQAQAAQAGMTAIQGAQGLSNIDLGGGQSALNMLISGGGGQQVGGPRTPGATA